MKKPKEKNKGARPPPDDPEESARFIETAKVVGFDAAEFKRAVKAVIAKKPSARKSG